MGPHLDHSRISSSSVVRYCVCITRRAHEQVTGGGHYDCTTARVEYEPAGWEIKPRLVTTLQNVSLLYHKIIKLDLILVDQGDGRINRVLLTEQYTVFPRIRFPVAVVVQ